MLFLRLDQVHTVITDTGITPEDCAALEEKGIQVLIAEAGRHAPVRGGEL